MDSELMIELSHEFRTPLAILLGNLELLENENGIRNRRALRVMREALGHLTRLTGRTLETARLEKEGEASGRMLVDVSVLLEAVRDECAVLAEARGIMFGVTESISERFHGDRVQMKEVLLNLVANALQHTKRGGSVFLSARLAGEGIEIAVADTGCGIAPEELPYIFDRFYRIGERVPGALADYDARGTGLGLHICRRIVEAHGGVLCAESEPGKGSRFTVCLSACATINA